MNKLSKLINIIQEDPQGELFDTTALIAVDEGTRQEHYVDARTTVTEPTRKGIHVVNTFAHFQGCYYYTCPDCGQIHRSLSTGKIAPGCCYDIDCMRKNALHPDTLVKCDPIILLDETGEE